MCFLCFFSFILLTLHLLVYFLFLLPLSLTPIYIDTSSIPHAVAGVGHGGVVVIAIIIAHHAVVYWRSPHLLLLELHGRHLVVGHHPPIAVVTTVAAVAAVTAAVVAPQGRDGVGRGKRAGGRGGPHLVGLVEAHVERAAVEDGAVEGADGVGAFIRGEVADNGPAFAAEGVGVPLDLAGDEAAGLRHVTGQHFVPRVPGDVAAGHGVAHVHGGCVCVGFVRERM